MSAGRMQCPVCGWAPEGGGLTREEQERRAADGLWWCAEGHEKRALVWVDPGVAEPAGWWSLGVDLTGSRLGPVFRRVELVLDDDPTWPPHRMRHAAAEHYGVPLEQVGTPDFVREPHIPDPPHET